LESSFSKEISIFSRENKIIFLEKLKILWKNGYHTSPKFETPTGVLFLVCARQPGGEGPNVNRRLALYLMSTTSH
jgi:hypothetical protein